jgi:hypothetical protein
LEGKVIENTEVLEKLWRETPEPFISEDNKKGRPLLVIDLGYFIDVEDDGNGESENPDQEEEDGDESECELPPLDDFSH